MCPSATFQAPDTEPQQEDTPTDLDQEEMEWRAWLGELMRDFPSPAEGVDEDDGDYNFLADQQQEAEEVEEFRNDRAVRIPGGWAVVVGAAVCHLCVLVLLQTRKCQTSLKSSSAV